MGSIKNSMFKSSLSFMLVIHVLIISTLLAIVSALIQLNIEYSNEIKRINNQIDEIREGYANSLSLALWHIDESQIDTLLAGIYNIPIVNYVELRTHNDQRHSYKGEKGTKNNIQEIFPIIYTSGNNEVFPIGNVYLEVATQGTFQLLRETAIVLLVTHIIKAILISSFILFINYLFILKHLQAMVSFFETDDTGNKNKTLVLDRKPNKLNENDELQMVVSSVNRYIAENRKLSNDLVQSKDQLEKRVDERTIELRSSLENLSTAQKKLVESAKISALGEVISGVAHEINTPLGITLTSITYLEDIVKKPETNNFDDLRENIMDIVNLIKQNISKMNNLITDFKLLAVDYNNKETTNFNLFNYIDEVVKILKVRYNNSSITFNIEGDDSIVINSFPGIFFQIVSNLISNSIEHGFGDNAGKINIKLEHKAKNIVITYSDNGKGVTKVESKKIFEPFYTTQRSKGHIGLGMNIVYNMVTQILSGTIAYIESTGLKLVIEFPII